MKDAAAAVASFFEKLGRFFDLFDLSFFVSGATAVGAGAFALYVRGVAVPRMERWVEILVLILACYVSGLLCFAAGRWLRMGTANTSRRKSAVSWFDSHFGTVLRAHGLDETEEVSAYLARADDRGIWRLYVRMWAEARQTPDLAESLALLNRYWVMAATYDGMTVALVVWIPALLSWSLVPVRVSAVIVGCTASLLLIALAVACAREAQRYVKYQAEELVAAIATRRARQSAG